MGKKKGKKGTSKPSQPSSGLRRRRRWNRLLKRLEMKIKRWERYQTEEKKARKKGWDTSGLKRYTAQLKEWIKRPPLRP